MRDKVCLFLRGVRVAAHVPLSGADPLHTRGPRHATGVATGVSLVRCVDRGAWRACPLCGVWLAVRGACARCAAPSFRLASQGMRPAACDARAPCGTQTAEYGAHGVSCARFVSEGMVSVMAALDILAPVLVIVAAIAAVAIAYLAFTALKDRSDRRRDEELMNGYRSKRR